MKPRVLLPLASLLLVTACYPAADLEVSWSIGAPSSPSQCAAYGIHRWEVSVSGPDAFVVDIDCDSPWDTGYSFYTLLEGYYDIRVRALTNQGALLAERVAERVPVFGFQRKHVQFEPSDFKPGNQARIDVYWNINGTVDGTAKGQSWDTCAEVGAKTAVVTVNGTPISFDCHASGQMSGSVSVAPGTHQVRVKLVDANGAALTTEATKPVTATVATPGPMAADFYYLSFLQGLKTSMKGTYAFSTAWGIQKLSCDATNPNVAHTIVRLSQSGGGSAVSATVTGPDGTTFPADGVATGKCYPQTQSLQIKNLTWGLYGLRVQGAVSASGGFEVCWEKKGGYKDRYDSENKVYLEDILVGAGDSNPVRALTIDRYSTAGVCAP